MLSEFPFPISAADWMIRQGPGQAQSLSLRVAPSGGGGLAAQTPWYHPSWGQQSSQALMAPIPLLLAVAFAVTRKM